MWKYYRCLKIKNRLIVSCGLLVLIPLLVIGITSVSQSKSTINNKISNYSSQIISQIGINISNAMNDNSNFVRTVMINPRIQDYLESRKATNSFSDYYEINNLSKLINTKVSPRNDISSLGIIDANSIQIGTFPSGFSDDIKKIYLIYLKMQKEDLYGNYRKVHWVIIVYWHLHK